MTIRRRFVGGALANLLAMGFSQGSTLVISIAVARILKLHAYGQYSTLYTTLLAAATLAQVATGNTAAKFVAEYRISDPRRAGRVIKLLAITTLVMASVGALAIGILAPWLSTGMLNEPELVSGLRWGAVFLFFFALNGYQLGVLSGLEAYKSLARAGGASGLAAIVAVSGGALIGGRDGAIIGLSLGAMARWAVHYAAIGDETRRQGIPHDFGFQSHDDGGVLFGFAIPMALSGWYSWSMFWLSNAFLVNQPNGFAEMGIYSAANTIRILVLFLPSVINTVGLSILNNERAKGQGGHKQVFQLNLLASSVVSALGIGVIGLLGRPILAVFGRDFRGGYVLLWMLLASTFFDGISMALFQYVQMRSRIWMSLFWIILPRDTVLVIASARLIPIQLGTGLAHAYLLASILGFFLHLSLVGLLIWRSDASTGRLAPRRVFSP
jgi:O-antigen/teichoic acid export membrane protein